MLHEADLSEQLTELLHVYTEIGGVLDYVILQPEARETEETLHREAALTAIEIIDHRLEQYAIKTAKLRGIDVSLFFRLTWNPDRLSGHPIPVAEFWGISHEEASQLGSDTVVYGYARDFYNLPYGLRLSGSELDNLFADLNEHLFGHHLDALVIYDWSTDWSNYFDAGHEWWGANYWTITVPERNWIVVIGASSTD